LKSQHTISRTNNPANRSKDQDHTLEVLIVDDDPQIAEVLQQLLEDEGYVVAKEPDGRSALSRIERNPPDVVLADMRMPRLGGVGLLREINLRFNSIEVILMSATESPRGLSVPFLQKPFDFEEVLNAICNYQRQA
jgi:CheY-like chemotaxis protein